VLVVMHTTAAILDPAGKFVRYQGTFVDVTEQREMERRLHREQEFAGRLMESFPDLVIALDTGARYTFVSPQVARILGYGPEELIGKRIGGRTDPADRTAMLEMFDELVSQRLASGEIEYRTQHKSGQWRVFRASARPLHDENGRITGVIASARDITDQQRLQQQLIQSERLAAMGQRPSWASRKCCATSPRKKPPHGSLTSRTARRAAPRTSCRACSFSRGPRRRAARCCTCQIFCSARCSFMSTPCAPITFTWILLRGPIFPPCWATPIN
jgi:PAS domain S-box-containing protein